MFLVCKIENFIRDTYCIFYKQNKTKMPINQEKLKQQYEKTYYEFLRSKDALKKAKDAYKQAKRDKNTTEIVGLRDKVEKMYFNHKYYSNEIREMIRHLTPKRRKEAAQNAKEKLEKEWFEKLE